MNSPPSTPTLEKLYQQALEGCPDCAGMGFFRRDLPLSHPDFGKPIACNNPYHTDERLNRLAKLSQMSREDLNRRLTDISVSDDNREVIEAATEVIARGYGWLYIWGGPGNAKSEVVKAIINHFNLNGDGPAIYTTLGNLLDYVRGGFADNSYSSKFLQLRSAKVLGIDEMDKVRASEWVDDFTFHFLNDRYNTAVTRETLTVFVGQPHPSEIFGDVVYDRFRDGRFRIVENKAPSARPNMKW